MHKLKLLCLLSVLLILSFTTTAQDLPAHQTITRADDTPLVADFYPATDEPAPRPPPAPHAQQQPRRLPAPHPRPA